VDGTGYRTGAAPAAAVAALTAVDEVGASAEPAAPARSSEGGDVSSLRRGAGRKPPQGDGVCALSQCEVELRRRLTRSGSRMSLLSRSCWLHVPARRFVQHAGLSCAWKGNGAGE
jgi:hypothetical protein